MFFYGILMNLSVAWGHKALRSGNIVINEGRTKCSFMNETF